ncbi:MAG: RagB/SusD family nutrient uptake outer membrane protein, partial [Flammeovirgaceae bacterium]
PSTTAKDVATAEIRALRAHYYQILMDLYGGVPLFKETTTTTNLAKSTRTEVFNFVESELKTALLVLPNAVSYARVTAPVVQAMLARLYLNAEVYTGVTKWAEATTAADAVINSGFYNLSANFEDNFSPTNEGSKENIFVVPFNEISVQGNNIVQMTMHYGNQVTYNLQNQPWNGYCTMEEFYNSFSSNDKRLSKSLLVGPQFASDGTTPIVDGAADPTDPDGLKLVFVPKVNELEPTAWREGGARIFKFPPKFNATQNLDNDFPIYRYADVLLMKAEAQYKLGNSAVAQTLINQVRTRAGLTGISSVTDDAILAERGRELFAEAVRRTDLIRFGKFENFLSSPLFPPSKTFGPISNPNATFKRIYPFPKTALANNTALVQNPGY